MDHVIYRDYIVNVALLFTVVWPVQRGDQIESLWESNYWRRGTEFSAKPSMIPVARNGKLMKKDWMSDPKR